MIVEFLDPDTRTVIITRETKETHIRLRLSLDQASSCVVDTSIPFFSHMLTAFAVHGGFAMELTADGDVDVEAHHLVEDTAIVLGRAFSECLGNKRGIRRFGAEYVPMDEALIRAVVDLSGRSFCVFDGEPEYMRFSLIPGTPQYSTVLNEHFFTTFAQHSSATLHVSVLAGRDPHHITEAEFKACARAYAAACALTSEDTIPSTKGTLT